MGIETAMAMGPALEGAAGGSGSGIMDLVGNIGGTGMQLVGGYLQGQSAEKQAKKARELQLYLERQRLYSQGAFAPTVPLMKDSLGRLTSAYDQTGQFISPYAGGNEAYDRLIQMGMDPNLFQGQTAGVQQGLGTIGQAAGGLQSFISGGGLNITPDQVTGTAQSLLNSDLMNAQIDAMSRDITRNLGENALPSIRMEDIATGNLGSSRGGVREAVAVRGAADRIADFRGALTGQAMSQAQNLLQGNVSNATQGYGALAGMGANQIQGSGAAVDVTGNMLGTLGQVGQLQQGLDQSAINNMIAARDYDLTREAQYGNLLRQYASVGNLPKGMV